MSKYWLNWCTKVDLRPERGEGQFADGAFRGAVLHVNVGDTDDQFFEAGPNENPDGVCPTFEVHFSDADGGVHQYLPLNWQPDCQRDGNQAYIAIEVAGYTSTPMNPYQLTQIASIITAVHEVMGMPYEIANEPGEWGFGTHAMGGAAWGGHPCPGTIRAAQRQLILDMAQGKDDDMPLSDADVAKVAQAAAQAVWAEPIPYKGVTANASTWLAAANRYAQSANELLGTAKTGVLSRVAALQAAVSSLSIGGVDTDALIAKIRAITWSAK